MHQIIAEVIAWPDVAMCAVSGLITLAAMFILFRSLD